MNIGSNPILWIGLLAGLFMSCAPEKDRQIFEDGAKYMYKVTKTDSTGTAFQDTFVMRIKGGFIQEGLFDQIPVEWFEKGNEEDSLVEGYVKDNTNGVTLNIPYDLDQWALVPVIPNPKVAMPLGQIETWNITRKGRMDHLGIDSVKHRFQNKGKADCKEILSTEKDCWRIKGKNLNQHDQYGEWVLEAWFHQETGFVKWLYEKVGTDYTITFELVDFQLPKDNPGRA